MDQLLQTQLNRTNVLLKALEVAKICDNPLAENLIIDIRRCINKSQTVLDKCKTVVERKKEISEEMDKLGNKCDILAQRAEKINDTVFPNQSFNTSTPSKNRYEPKITEQPSNGLEISPCPVTWYNGYLESPMPTVEGSQPGTSHIKNNNQLPSEAQIPRITFLHPHEMQSIPAYMKGRLTCENVNSFIKIVNSVLKQKYSITLLKRKEVKRKDLVHYCEWKSQEQEFGLCGKAFFTTDDLLNLGNQKLDKITDKMIQILRHSNRLRQTRANGNKVVIYSLI